MCKEQKVVYETKKEQNLTMWLTLKNNITEEISFFFLNVTNKMRGK